MTHMRHMTSVLLKESKYLDKQARVLEKHKGPKRWFWSALKRYPWEFGFATLSLLGSVFFQISPLMKLGVAFDILLKEGFTSAFNKTILIMLIQVY